MVFLKGSSLQQEKVVSQDVFLRLMKKAEKLLGLKEYQKNFEKISCLISYLLTQN